MSMNLGRAALVDDVRRRIAAIHGVMDRSGVDIVVAAAAGAPAQTGWMRYLTGADLWSGQAFVVVERTELEPIVVLWSNYLAEWVKQEGTSQRIESTLERRITPMTRVVELLKERIGNRGTVGMLGMNRNMYLSEWQVFRRAFPEVRVVELSEEVNKLRQIKSPFEVAAMKEMGSLLAEALNLFEAIARPGRDALEVSGEIEGFLRGKGCVWGRAKYSLDQRPYTLPAPLRRRLTIDDIILFQFVYSSPLGYWYELGCLYSFVDLPPDTARRLAAMERAMRETAAICVPGTTYGMVSEVSDRVFREAGLELEGKHTEDCHSIGTDISDGPPFYDDAWRFEENMVLALHPASLVRGDLAFFICDHVLVQPGGGITLSPVDRYYRRLDTN